MTEYQFLKSQYQEIFVRHTGLCAFLVDLPLALAGRVIDFKPRLELARRSPLFVIEDHVWLDVAHFLSY